MQDLSAHIMDIVQNSVRAKADRIVIDINESVKNDKLVIQIEDNGQGMDEETLKKVTDPFFTSRTVRKVGLGIPLLKQNAERTGGSFSIQSTPGQGTILNAVFQYSHLDRPPMGDIADTVVLLLAANPEINFIYSHHTDTGEYEISSEEINEFLEGLPINDPEIMRAIREMIRENLKEIKTT